MCVMLNEIIGIVSWKFMVSCSCAGSDGVHINFVMEVSGVL